MTALTPEAVAGGLTNAQRETCETCQGRGFCQLCPGSEEWPCTWCADPDHRSVSLILERATPEQKSLLLWGEATLAYQPMTPAEWDEHLCNYYVEEDDEGEKAAARCIRALTTTGTGEQGK